MFCIYLRTNSDLCHLHHKLIGFYNRDEKCLLRGTTWVFKQSSLPFVFILLWAPLSVCRVLSNLYKLTSLFTVFFFIFLLYSKPIGLKFSSIQFGIFFPQPPSVVFFKNDWRTQFYINCVQKTAFYFLRINVPATFIF